VSGVFQNRQNENSAEGDLSDHFKKQKFQYNFMREAHLARSVAGLAFSTTMY